MSPTARTLEKLRADGFIACVVEKWIPMTPAGFKGKIIRKDAFSFGDILAAKIGIPGATLVQTTDGSSVSKRIDKIRKCPEAGIWMAAGNRILVHGWSVQGARGTRKLWTCREIDVGQLIII